MKFFVVTYVHYDLDLWKKHLQPHLAFLRGLAAAGTLRASGPIQGPGPTTRAGLLIMAGADREQVIRELAGDPYQVHGVVDELTIRDWDPVFGVFSAESSGEVGG